MEKLREGFDEALFVAFREACRFLKKDETGAGKFNYCEHPRNPWRGRYRDLPNCALQGCPIYKKLVQMPGPQQQFDAFIYRLEEFPL